MAVELDHDAIKTRIVDILKANATLFDANDLTKIRFIDVGFPDGDPFNDQMFPYIFVTNASPFETIRNKGNTPTSGGNIIVKALDHQFDYDIVCIVNAKSAREAELNLDDFQKLILELLEADLSLVGAGSALVHISFPTGVRHYRQSGTEQKGVKGRIITLRCFEETT